jgi:hypothetical protein
MAGIAEPVSTAMPAKPRAEEPAARTLPLAGAREFAAVVLFVVLADVTLYRGAGYAGIALLVALSPLFILLGAPVRRLHGSFWLTGAMITLLAVRMAWQGSALAVALGAALLIAFALALRGVRPTVFDCFAGLAQLPFAGLFALDAYSRSFRGVSPRLSSTLLLQVLLPLGAVAAFGTLFVLANPDLVTFVNTQAVLALRWLTEWAESLSQNVLEVLFWVVAGYVALGLLRPLITHSLATEDASAAESPAPPTSHSDLATSAAPLYVPLRNMLWAVICLFSVYLVFEFQTLWFRQFPKGFYYAGYAHEGAAWLTVALGLATLVLSLMFRGRVLADPRLGRLRMLAWTWSALNLLLALTVYHRMAIYIEFNGMTRMRTIGLFGITTVLIGFALVLWKIVHNRSFLWLINRQLWALAGAVYLFALTPVDTLVHTYNVRQILAGDLAPSVQISEHPISAEGYLVLLPLVDCDDPLIRDGIRAMLAQRQLQAEQQIEERRELGWASRQVSEEALLRRLRQHDGAWREMTAERTRRAALTRYRKYAYQWY